ncbi:hypothetical protein SBRCBS47491_002857 [Sporothrix bragantina]|uniref:DUF3074 domain-containing protein n=1 Tax=Sporothrix bragantina TaxID=671064 RepID=A0ABP0BBD5_9PEZI
MAPTVDENNPLAALGPIAWDTVDCDQLDDFLTDTFVCAQLIADSIPATSTSSSAYTGNGGRPRSHTDGAVSYGRNEAAAPVVNPTDTTASDTTGKGGAALSLEEKAALLASEANEKAKKQEKIRQDLRQLWKPVNTGGANPREIVVYKMNGGRDGYAGSSWFARRSLHRVEKAKPATGKKKDANAGGQDVRIGFDMFRRALLREFTIQGEEAEDEVNTKAKDISVKGTAKGKTSEATSTVRTMITKKRLEHIVVGSNGNEKNDDATKSGPTSTRQLDVYLLEAIFPGPTAARDFVTMLLTAESPCSLPDVSTSTTTDQHGLRQFMLVSKPCQHPETLNRQGYVRAQYESVEMIREVRVPVVPSAKSGMISSAANNTRKTRSSIDLSHGHLDDNNPHVDFDDATHETAIEWLMITRNNPGGSVPRFLVDKSTPSSIISDANKFLDWLVTLEVEATVAESEDVSETSDTSASAAPVAGAAKTKAPAKALAEHAIPEEDEEDTLQQIPAQNNNIDGAADESQRNASISPPVTILSMESSGGAASSAKLFNILTGALGGAVPAVASKLPNPFGGAVEVLNSSFEGQHDIEDDEDTGGETYSDIDEEEELGDEVGRGRSRRSASDGNQTQDMKPSAPSIRSIDSSSVASIQAPPPTTALEILAHSRAVALGRLNDPTSAGQSTGASSIGSNTDTENDTKKGSHSAAAKKKETEHSAAKAAKVAKAAEAAQKRHEKELRKLQDRQRKAEEDILKGSNKKKAKEEFKVAENVEKAVPVEVATNGVEKDVQSSQQKTNADSSSSTSSLSAAVPASVDPATRTEIQKLREKHEKAVARQEAQYKKEIEKLERKQQQQAEKDAARLRKQQEREEKADAAKQLAHARAERDVARKEADMLAEKVKHLEAQNELLTAELAKLKGESTSTVEATV